MRRLASLLNCGVGPTDTERFGMMILTLLALPWSAFTILAASDGAQGIIEFLSLVYGSVAFSGAWVLVTIFEWRNRSRRRVYWRKIWSYAVPLIIVSTLDRLGRLQVQKTVKNNHAAIS